ncbi:hypothetical protein DPMN_031424 [Dreissena polymorpha]|uniref:Uncharacterized protein n=1 Tax=Dreissena polymorpha TaxID=45954 RepID=A0A9D4M2B8_DREPO|nr:hypothetical protein DPMN_031424 [Dreissena polymorpha]
MVWPNGGSPADVISSIQARFDRYADYLKRYFCSTSTKPCQQKTMRECGVLEKSLLIMTSHLLVPCQKRGNHKKQEKNQQRLARILGTFNLGENVKMETPDDGLFDHDETDVTIVSYMLKCAKSNHGVVRVLSDDTDIFILLGVWVYRANVVFKWNDGTVLY